MAAGVLGFTQKNYDNQSGKEKQPASMKKVWAKLTDSERAAAAVLGYNRRIWENRSGKEEIPASASKYWIELSCESRAIADTHFLPSLQS